MFEIPVLTIHDDELKKEKRRLKFASAKPEVEEEIDEEKQKATPFPCEEYGCSRRFGNFQGFKIHMKSSHKYSEKDFDKYCDICGRQFSSKNSLNSHIENAHYFHCEQCEQKFQEKHSLESHVRRMHGRVKNNCTECGASFRSAETLKLHMKIHEKPNFDCSKCSRQFMTKHELENHILDHEQREKFEKEREEEEARENAKRWRCDRPTCNKTFLTEKSFKMHEEMHSAEDDSRKECPKCHKFFMTDKSLNFHMETSHPDIDLGTVTTYYLTYMKGHARNACQKLVGTKNRSSKIR